MDTSGPIPLKSIREQSYFLTMTTSKNRYMRVKIMKSLDDSAANVIDFMPWLDRNSKQSVKKIHTDSEGEFLYM